ncbi:hypothetical protein, partial [Salmonella sp. s51884]|uniref:hypothetical protein n=1 Tax=Salmonella sp. s51884 TaxID=3159654 RepID=UPI003980BCED
MLITDGEDGNQEMTTAVKQEIIENKVIIDTIATSNSASHDIVDLAEQTGGKLYLQTDSQSTGTRDAFIDTQASG